MIRCNNCYALFDDDDNLALLQEDECDSESWFKGCPHCKTDAYLMDDPILIAEGE